MVKCWIWVSILHKYEQAFDNFGSKKKSRKCCICIFLLLQKNTNKDGSFVHHFFLLFFSLQYHWQWKERGSDCSSRTTYYLNLFHNQGI